MAVHVYVVLSAPLAEHPVCGPEGHGFTPQPRQTQVISSLGFYCNPLHQSVSVIIAPILEHQ